MTWISKARAAGLTDTTVRQIERMIQSAELRSRHAIHLSANNRRPTLVCLEDLGSEAIRRHHDSAPATASSPVAAPPAPPALGDPHSPDPSPAERPACAVEAALRRQALVERVLARQAASGRGDKTRIVREVAAAAGISRGALYRYLRAYALRGFDGLLPRWGRPSSVEQTILGFIQQQYLDPRQPLMADIYDRTVAFCVQIRRPAPSYRTVVRVCAETDPSAAAYHRLGRKAWAQTYEPILRRDYTDLAVGEMWCGDHRELDVFVRVGDRLKRPWLTAWLDMRSRLLVGAHLSFGPSSRTIALAFRQGVLACGRPASVYIDNGKDYRSHTLNGREQPLGRIQFDAETQGVFGRLNVAVIHAKPYAARSKPIERWFGTLSLHFDRQQPGWCGRDHTQRPEKLKGEIARGELLDLETMHRRLCDYLAHYNTEVEHSELGCPPAALWTDAAKEIPDARALDLLMMKATVRTVTHEGIRMLNCRYWATELVAWIGRPVDVRYDPADVRRVIVFAEGQFVCEAATAELGSMKTGEEVMRQKAKERKAALDRVRRYRQDIQVVYSPDEALALARANARVVAPAAPARQAAVGGTVVPLLTGMERTAAVVAPELPDGPPAPTAAAVNDAWRAFEEDQLAGMEADRLARAAAEARARKGEREQWRMLGLDDPQGGDA